MARTKKQLEELLAKAEAERIEVESAQRRAEERVVELEARILAAEASAAATLQSQQDAETRAATALEAQQEAEARAASALQAQQDAEDRAAEALRGRQAARADFLLSQSALTALADAQRTPPAPVIPNAIGAPAVPPPAPIVAPQVPPVVNANNQAPPQAVGAQNPPPVPVAPAPPVAGGTFFPRPSTGAISMAHIRSCIPNEYDSIQRDLQTYVAMAKLDITVDVRQLDHAKLALIIRAARQEHPVLNRFPADWALVAMVKQFVQNKRKRAYTYGHLDVPANRRKRNSGGGDGAGTMAV